MCCKIQVAALATTPCKGIKNLYGPVGELPDLGSECMGLAGTKGGRAWGWSKQQDGSGEGFVLLSHHRGCGDFTIIFYLFCP